MYKKNYIHIIFVSYLFSVYIGWVINNWCKEHLISPGGGFQGAMTSRRSETILLAISLSPTSLAWFSMLFHLIRTREKKYTKQKRDFQKNPKIVFIIFIENKTRVWDWPEWWRGTDWIKNLFEDRNQTQRVQQEKNN